MSDYDAWLGHVADELTDEQMEAFTRAADDYYALPFHQDRDPEDDMANAAEDDAALTAILQHVLREDSLRQVAVRYRRAKAELDGWIRAYGAVGIPEVTIAEDSGLSRVTVRKRLGR